MSPRGAVPRMTHILIGNAMNAKVDTTALNRPVTRQTFDDVLVPTYAPAAMVPVRGSGLDLWDQSGKHYLDFTSGIAVNALSTHDTQGESGWKGLMLGYAQVPAEQMEGLVKQLAALVHLAAYAANCSEALKMPYPPARRTSGRSRR